MTILMGVVANYPLALATGLGLNAFVAFGIASQMTWADAMGLVVIEGLVILVLVLTGFRQAVFHAVPAQLKIAISVGIGLFIALIGFVDAGFVRRSRRQDTVPVQLGATAHSRDGRSRCSPRAALVVLWVRGQGRDPDLDHRHDGGRDGGRGHRRLRPGRGKNPKGWGLNLPAPDNVIDNPDFATLCEFSLLGSFQAVGVVAALLLVFTLLFADFFDTMGTMTAIGAEAGLLDAEGIPPNTRASSWSTRSPPPPVARRRLVEHFLHRVGLGVGEGARTGLASVVTGVLFLLRSSSRRSST